MRRALRALALCVCSSSNACADSSFEVAPPAEDATTDVGTVADGALDAVVDVTVADAADTSDAGAPEAFVDATRDAGCETACGSGTSCVAGACVPGCAGKIVYVSGATGDDARDGCTPKAAKKTITSALAFVETSALVGHEVHVCKGTYAENLVLKVPASLLGGYDCATWARVDGYGAPKFDPVNETTLTGAAAPLAVEVLRIVSARITKAILVDGFTIRGNTSTPLRSVGVLVDEQAAPVLSNDKIDGGGGINSTAFVPSGEGASSVGVAVRGDAYPEIVDDVITGGSGVSSSATIPGNGSLGIEIAGTARGAHIHRNKISGGSGVSSAGQGSVGVIAWGKPGVVASPIIMSGTSGSPKTMSTAGPGPRSPPRPRPMPTMRTASRSSTASPWTWCGTRSPRGPAPAAVPPVASSVA